MTKPVYIFPYIDTDTGSFARPIIPITLRNKHTVTETYGLVDSGSDLTIFHADFAAVLGVRLENLETIRFSGIKKGSDASATGYISPLEIGIEETFFKTIVLFSFDIPSSAFGILGQTGIFDIFTILFDKANKQLTLT
jgi:hypothetical protein